MYDFCVYVLLSGIVDPSTAHLCEQQGQISMKDCINKLLEIDITKHTQLLPSESGSGVTSRNEKPTLDSAYSINDLCQAERPSAKKFKHLSLPELNLMKVEYKVVHDISVTEFDIDPFVEAQSVKEEDSYVMFRKDRKPVCWLREKVKKHLLVGEKKMFYAKSYLEFQFSPN